MRKKSRIDIPLHAISRYKQRVIDDPQRYILTDGQISRRVNNALDYIGDLETLPILGDDYSVVEARFKVRGGATCLYFCVLGRDRLKFGGWRLVTILTQEMYERGLIA